MRSHRSLMLLGGFVVAAGDGPATAIEAELNALGNERWEVYWMTSTNSGLRVFLKRPSISDISRVPLSDLLRMFGGSGQ